jgi:hypothetical protein
LRNELRHGAARGAIGRARTRGCRSDALARRLLMRARERISSTMKKQPKNRLTLDRQTVRALTNHEVVLANGGRKMADSGFAQCRTTQAWTWCTQFAATECVCG